MQTILEPQSLASTGLQELMREMLVRLGEEPERDGLRDTPKTHGTFDALVSAYEVARSARVGGRLLTLI